jgi:hypothetical protein
LPSGDSIPTPNRPKLAYTVNYGGSTEWFAGNFYLPRPRGNTGIHYAAIHLSMLLFLSPQIFRQEPHKFADDELVAFSKFAVHRMPAIDLSMSDRIFMRDSVSRFRKADKK